MAARRTLYPDKWKKDPKYKGTMSSGVSKLVDALISGGNIGIFATDTSRFPQFGSGATGRFTDPEDPNKMATGISIKAGSPRGGNVAAMHEIVHAAQEYYPQSEVGKAARKYGDYIVKPKYSRMGQQEKFVRRQIPRGHVWSGLTSEGEPLETDYSSASTEIPAYYYTSAAMPGRNIRGKQLKSYLKQSGMDIPPGLIEGAVGDLLAVQPPTKKFSGGDAVYNLMKAIRKKRTK